MDEFRRRPTAPSAPLEPETTAPTLSSVAPQPLGDTPGLAVKPPKKSKKKVIIWSIAGVVGALLLAVAGLFTWYMVQLSPVDAANTDKKVVSVASGSSPTAIATLLEDEGVIRSATAFLWYTRVQGVQNTLQAGAYRLSPSESTQQIVEHLVGGRVDVFDVTFFPGATLVNKSDTPDDKKYDVTTALKRVGYTQEEITAGLEADYSEYNDTLFQGKPASADLEGYVYGETYRMASDATVEEVLRTSFNHFWSVIEKNDLVAQFEAQDMSLYEGLTLASIIQMEAGSTPDDMAQISQVFHTRLDIGMPLGSDPTYQYIADKQGVPRSTTIDSPYNTRRYAGLPPGPIATAGEKALIAVVSPASGDYLYFLSGDDNVTYFSRTLEEHEANIVNHCQKKCQIL